MKRSDPLPKNLEPTPERLAKIEEQQKLLREQAIARGRLSPEAQRVQLGITHEASARAEVEMLESEGHKVRTSERLRLARTRLAEALALQGRYNDAAAIESDKAQQAHYTRMWGAVWIEDDVSCPCEPFQEGELSLTHDHVAEEVLSMKHNKLMPAIRCNCCGFVNVRPLTAELQERLRLQLESQKIVHGYRPDELRNNAGNVLAKLRDTQVLKRR